ncbi:hypothetical protein D1872_67220 [compost metagenome]
MTSIFAMFWDMLFYVTISAYELYYTGEVDQSKGIGRGKFQLGGRGQTQTEIFKLNEKEENE